MSINCTKKCCKLLYTPYNITHHGYRKNNYKAGVVLHDKTKNSILVIQSRGNLWGFPKGSFESGETFEECAIRELKEETGIQIIKERFIKELIINKYVRYYYVEFNQDSVEINNHIDNHDATGIGWIKVNCFVNLIKNNTIKINYHAKRCLNDIFNVYL